MNHKNQQEIKQLKDRVAALEAENKILRAENDHIRDEAAKAIFEIVDAAQAEMDKQNAAA